MNVTTGILMQEATISTLRLAYSSVLCVPGGIVQN
jgi:hypothetical protein